MYTVLSYVCIIHVLFIPLVFAISVSPILRRTAKCFFKIQRQTNYILLLSVWFGFVVFVWYCTARCTYRIQHAQTQAHGLIPIHTLQIQYCIVGVFNLVDWVYRLQNVRHTHTQIPTHTHTQEQTNIRFYLIVFKPKTHCAGKPNVFVYSGTHT